MSAEQKLKMAEPEILDGDSLEPQTPLDIEDLYDAPDPLSLEDEDEDDFDPLECDLDQDTDVRGYLPSPEHPRGLNEDLPELDGRESGFQAISTDESHVRDRMLWTHEQEEAKRNHQPTAAEVGLRDWRLKSGQKRREAAELERIEKQVRRKSLAMGVGIGVGVGLLALGGLWALTSSGEPDVTAGSEAVTTGTPTEAVTTGTPTEAVTTGTPTEATGPAVEAPPASLWAPPVVEGSYASWTQDDHRFWQFDYASEQTLRLRWLDAAGAVVLDDSPCGRIDGATGRCYVGRSVERFEWLVRQGAAAGTWTVEACEGSQCGAVGSFEVSP
jgi:hypothetical protein